jgi:copper(I)-binding protein
MIDPTKRAIDHSADTLRQRRRAALRGLGFSVAMLAASTAYSGELLHWQDVWVRAMPPGAQVTAAYGKLMNHGNEAVEISGLSSSVSGETQMHDVIAAGDQRRMVQLMSVEIAPHETLIFEPGGRHIMLLDISNPPAERSVVEICALSAAGTQACAEAAVERQAPASHEEQ